MSTTDEVVSDVVSKNKVQVFGRKKTATAVAICRRFSGDRKGSIRINGRPLELMEPKSLQLKILEPFLLLGESRTRPFDIRVRVNGGGTISRIYAIRQAIAKSIVAYCQKFIDEATKEDLRKILKSYDKSLMVADPRRCEPKKFGGPGARARYQKSYR